MTLDWDRIVDGRLHRLRRGRDFDGNPSAFRRVVKLEARRRRQPVQIGRDMGRPDRVLWVQFGRATVRPGDRCPCGGLPERVHSAWCRCSDCGSLLAFAPARTDDPDGPVRREDNPLEAFDEIVLYAAPRSDELERLVGYGKDESGNAVLLEVEYPLREGARILKEDGSFEQRVHFLSLASFDVAVDLSGFAALGDPVSLDDEDSSSSSD